METGAKAGDVSAEEQSPSDRAWLSSVMIGDYPGLEDDVTIELSQRCTILFGKNGAGKSLILDAIESVENGPQQRAVRFIPGRFQCTVSEPDGRDLRYEYTRTARPSAGAAAVKREASPFEISQTAWKKVGSEWVKLQTQVEEGSVTIFPTIEGFLAHSSDPEDPSWKALHFLAERRPSVRVSSGVPRDERSRQVIFHHLSPNRSLRPEPHEADGSSRLQRLSLAMASIALSSKGADELERLQAAARRVGVARSIRLEVYEPTDKRGKKEAAGVCEIAVDGTNIGILSDGTLRVLETLLQLNSSSPSTILLEEPETGIHPGLLARLLREIDSYEGQVIISTHSPQVVSWAKPDEIRLVERHDGKTTVRSLTPSETDRVHEYLSHDGTLGEFVYGGALDGED